MLKIILQTLSEYGSENNTPNVAIIDKYADELSENEIEFFNLIHHYLQ